MSGRHTHYELPPDLNPFFQINILPRSLGFDSLRYDSIQVLFRRIRESNERFLAVWRYGRLSRHDRALIGGGPPILTINLFIFSISALVLPNSSTNGSKQGHILLVFFYDETNLISFIPYSLIVEVVKAAVAAAVEEETEIKTTARI